MSFAAACHFCSSVWKIEPSAFCLIEVRIRPLIFPVSQRPILYFSHHLIFISSCSLLVYLFLSSQNFLLSCREFLFKYLILSFSICTFYPHMSYKLLIEYLSHWGSWIFVDLIGFHEHAKFNENWFWIRENDFRTSDE